MLHECQLVSANFEEDPEQMGHIVVRHNRRERWARPMFGFGEVKIPTKEWIDEFAANNAIGVYCQEVNNQPYFIWVGFTIYKDKLPSEALANFAYRRVHFFSESWKIYTDDKVDQTTYVIEHKDGSKLIIDRKKGEEVIKIEDGLFGNVLQMDKDGVKINGEYVVLKPLVDWLNSHKADFGLGNMGAPVPFFTSTLTEFESGLLLPNKYTSNNS